MASSASLFQLVGVVNRFGSVLMYVSKRDEGLAASIARFT